MRSIPGGVPLLVALVVSLSGAGLAENLPDRIARVEQGLLPPIVMKGQVHEPMNLADRMEEYRAAGVSLAVIDNFDIAWSRAWGVSNVVSGEPLTTENIMQAGSVAKPVAAMLALRLVADGRFSLDDPANEVLTSLKIPDAESGGGTQVLVRHLLSHSAGLAPGYFVPTKPGAPLPSLLDQLKGARNEAGEPMVERIAPPGRQAIYSNPAYGLIQMMLVDASGEEFDALAETELFEALSMTRSSFAPRPPEDLFQDAAWGHSWNRETQSLEPLEGKGQIVPGAVGGLWSTPTDLCRFLIGIMSAARKTNEGILPSELAKEMIRPQVENMGLGFAVTGRGSSSSIDHTGGMPGFYAYMIAYPATGQGAVVMVNGGYRVSRLVHELIRSVAVEYEWPEFSPERTVVPMDEAAFSRYVGKYRFDYPVNMEMSIAVRVGRIFRGSMEMLPVGGNLFVIPAAGDEVEFVLDGDRATAFVYGKPRMGKIRARRVE